MPIYFCQVKYEKTYANENFEQLFNTEEHEAVKKVRFSTGVLNYGERKKA